MYANPLFLLLLVTSLSNAETAISVGELSALQSETYLYKAQSERDKALRALENEGSLIPNTVPTVSSERLPVVKLVSGPRQALRAVLFYSSGYEIEAYVGGPELPGGYSVKRISIDNVVLSRAGKHYPLGFASSLPVTTGAGMGVPPQPMSLPGLPPGQPAPVFQP